MITPSYLKPGDCIALVAPARFMDMDKLEPFQNWVEEQGWKLLLSPNINAKQGQLGGSPAERLSDLVWAFTEPKVRAVFCARGGYGSMQLLSDSLDLVTLKQPKWLVGFSDITALHIHFNLFGVASIHGPMAMQFSDETACSKESKMKLALCLKGESSEWYNTNSNEPTSAALNPIVTNQYWGKPFRGEVWGGNMSMVYAMLASGYRAPSTPYVLLLEDLDEYLYHIDRMAQAFNQSGVWEHCEAVLVGSMVDMHDNAVPFGKNAKEIITEFCDFYKKPLIFGLPIGHERQNFSIKLGLDITFDGSQLIQN